MKKLFTLLTGLLLLASSNAWGQITPGTNGNQWTITTSGATTTITINTPGNYTFTPPAGVTTATVQTWGGGGGTRNDATARRGGGGGGAYAASTLNSLSGSYNVTIGAGGTAANPGNPGGNSFFGPLATPLVRAAGGSGGSDDGGDGGTVANSIGTTLFAGGNGGNREGGGGANDGGGGGASGSSFGAGGNGSNGGTNSNAGGTIAGGTNGVAGGNGGNGGTNNNNGQNGFAPGGGGGGRGNNGTAGVGANGRVIITYTTPPDLSLTAIVSNSTPDRGDNITVTLTATNTSSSSGATNVNVLALLPSGYTFNSLNSISAGTYNSGTGVWAIGALAASANATLVIEATVNCVGEYIFTSLLTADAEPNVSNNTATTGTVPQYGTTSCVVAVADFSAAIGSAGGVAIADVLANDLLNGNPVAPTAVLLTVSTPFANAGIVLNTTTRQVTVAPNTPPGDHVATYQICDITNPSICHTATVRVFISDLVDGYINQPVPSCQSVPDPNAAFGIQFDYQTPAGTDRVALYQTPLMADIDNDGVVEIIALSINNIETNFGNNQRSSQDIHIFNGQTGVRELTISTPYISHDGPTAFAIADVDGDGFGEIIVASLYARNAAADQKYLYCYEHTGALKWESNVQYGANTPLNASATAVGIADFNQDGTPEVYVYNEIFNALTGVKLADGGANGIGNPYTYAGVDQSITVAGDLTTSPGLELAAGRTVYNVVLTNLNGTAGNTMTPINFNEVNSGTDIDGYTALADIDLDGNLDVVVAARVGADDTRIYVWNPRATAGSRLIAQISTLGGNNVGEQHGALFIGDVDGNGIPEIGLCLQSQVVMLQRSGAALTVKWTLTTNDGSGRTGITMFDFNQDGIQEMVYRDETTLRIFNGSGASPVVLASIASASTTGMEGPIVGDVDGDGSAEILVSNQDGTNSGQVQIFRSSLDPWAPARSVWNQYAYYNTHINDNLDIPQFQSNHGQQLYFDNQFCPDQFAERPLNTFNVQSTYYTVNGCPSFPSFDAAIDIISATLPCPSTTLNLGYRVTNFADQVAIPAGTPITFYQGNPLAPGATELTTVTLASAILPGQNSGVLTVTLNGISPNTKIYAIANDDGSQVSPINMPTTSNFECNYANNFAAVTTRCETTNPDVNATLVNVDVNGNTSVNDNVPGGTSYGTSPTLVSSPGGSSPSISFNSDGTYNFVADIVGVYIYNVEVCIPPAVSPACGSEQLKITVTDATITGNPPTANTDIASTEQGSPVVLNTLANDAASGTGATLNPASITIVGTPPNAATQGSLSINTTTGEITFTPVPSFVGVVTYQYQVCETVNTTNCATATQEVTVLASGSAGVSAADDYNRTQQGNSITVNATNGLLVNDESTDGLTLEVSLAFVGSFTIPGKGTFNIAPNGGYIFTPLVGFTGPVSYHYEVCDANACANATLYIVVDPFRTTPDINATFVGVLVSGNVNTNDEVVAGSTYGTPVAIAGNPNAVLPVMNANGTYDFTPTLPGVYNYNVPVCLAGQTPQSSCKTELLTITVEEADITTGKPPVANTDVAYTKDDVNVVLKTLANDVVGVAGFSLNPASVTIISGTAPNVATQGSLSVNTTTGDITFDPVPGFTGTVTYKYSVCDDQDVPLCTEAYQEITVLPTEALNHVSASDDYIETEKGIAISGNVLTNDVDPEGDQLEVNIATVTNTAGSVTFAANGGYTFTPAANYTGPGEFIYTVCDDGEPSACTQATLHVLVNPETFTVGGTVWYDPDGLSNVTFDGNPQGSADPTNAGTAPLFINYIDDNGVVKASVPVEDNGSWTMDVVSFPGATLQLSTVQGVPGQAKPATTVPNNWGYVGEGTGTGPAPPATGDGNPNGEFIVTLAANQPSINFGIEIRPVTNPTATASTFPNPTGTGLQTINPTLFAGTDVDGTVEVIRITAFPTNATSFAVGTNMYYPNAAAIPGTCPAGFTCIDFSAAGFVEFPASSNTTSTPVPILRIDPLDNIQPANSIISVFTYLVIDNAGLPDDATGVVNVPFSGARSITVTGTPICIDDVPFMNYTISSNFDMTGLVGTISWTTGTPQAPNPLAVAIVNTATQNTPTLSGTSFSGTTAWPGAVYTPGAPNLATDWPGWIDKGGAIGWVYEEDGYSGYRSNDVGFSITVNPTDAIDGPINYPPSSPFCTSQPRVDTFTGTVWQDVDGSGTPVWANIPTGGETGTNAGTTLYAYALGISPETGLQTVLDKATVAANGTYSFTDLIQCADVTIVLSTDGSFAQGDDNVNNNIGAGLPTELLPAGWASTSPATRGGITTLLGNVSAADLGIQQLPISGITGNNGTVNNNTLITPIYNPGVIGREQIPAAAFGGTDPDGTLTALLISGLGTNVHSITIGGVAGTTYYKNAADIPAICPTANCLVFPILGLEIASNAAGQPTPSFEITPVSSFIDGNLTLDYKVIDNADVANGTGARSENTTTLTIPIVALKYDLTNGNSGWYNGGGAIGGPGNGFKPDDVNDGTKTLFWISTPGVPADILDQNAVVANLIVFPSVEAVVSACLTVNDAVKVDGSVRFKAINDGSVAPASANYGQYKGPTLPNTTFEMILSEEGWHNMGIPVTKANGEPISAADFATSNNTTANPQIVNLTNDERTHNLWRYDSEVSSGREQGFFIDRNNSGIPNLNTTYSTHAYGTWRMVQATDELQLHGLNYFVDGNNSNLFPLVVQMQGYTNSNAVTFTTHDNWGGWNLIPNVFPTSLSIANMNGDNTAPDMFGNEFDRAIWIWNPGDNYLSPIPGQFSKGAYVSVDAQTGLPVNYGNANTVLATNMFIAPMQSFYVRRLSASELRRKEFGANGTSPLDPYAPNPEMAPGTLTDPARTNGGTLGAVPITLHPDHRAGCEITPHYKTNWDLMMVYAIDDADENLGDATEIVFDQTFTSGIDVGFDIQKLGNRQGAPLLFSVVESKSLVINKIPYPEDVTTVPLGFYAEKNGHNYRIKMAEMPSGWQVYLEDKLTGSWHDFTSGDYSFKNRTDFRIERFVLHFSMKSAPIDPARPEAIVWGTQAGIEIHFDDMRSLQAEVVLSNLIGQVMHTNKAVSTQDNYIIPINDSDPQVYLVTVITEELTQTYKVVR